MGLLMTASGHLFDDCYWVVGLMIDGVMGHFSTVVFLMGLSGVF